MSPPLSHKLFTVYQMGKGKPESLFKNMTPGEK